MSDKTMSRIVFFGVCAILAVFTVFGFFVKQPCDVDRVYLWCRLHPFSFGDFLGCALFYSGALCIGGLTNMIGLTLTGKEGSIGKWPVIFGAAVVIGSILIWNT
jgi:hypothetical protein